jgi:hypothetical protein
MCTGIPLPLHQKAVRHDRWLFCFPESCVLKTICDHGLVGHYREPAEVDFDLERPGPPTRGDWI